MVRLVSTLAALLLTVPAFADEFTPALEAYMNDKIIHWVNDPAIVAAIKAQNHAHAGLSQAQIEEMDQEWRANIGDPSTPLLAMVLNHPVSDDLRARVDASMGAMTEVFVMDEHGLNVAASDVTSDMWQGDETKFQQTYGNGAGSIHISDVALDESTQRYQGQISVTIVDPNSGNAIGAITVGVDAEGLL